MYDLSNRSGSMRINMGSWEQLYKLGTLFGWKPAGTEASINKMRAMMDLPDDATVENSDDLAKEAREWEGGYFSNDWQTVTAEDAAAWADAIEKSLDDVPQHDAIAHKTNKIGGIASIPLDTPVSPFEWFSGDRGRATLTRFIEFCRAGSFCIG